MLNVHGGDVVRQQHHLVAVKLVGILVRQSGLLHLPHDPHDEAACSHERVDNVDALVG